MADNETGMIRQELNGVSFRLKAPFDFSFLAGWGRVFKVFDDQDSGNICFGTERPAVPADRPTVSADRSAVLTDRSSRRFFLKFAGAPTARYGGDPADAVRRLKAAVPVYRALAHPNLIQLVDAFETGGGYLAVFGWTDGVCMGKQYPEARAKFLTLPAEKRLKVFDAILDFHICAAAKGYAAVDFYDGSILYDFEQEKTILCDIDFYQKAPFTNTMGRMWGSARFMSPEEFTEGAVIDEVTNVFTMGAMAFALFGGELDRSRERWTLGEGKYAAALKAVSEKREERYQSLQAFKEAWDSTQ